MSNSTSTGSPQALQKAALALTKMRARVDELERARREPIAIVGMACRYPGGATNPDSFWKLLCEGKETVREIPPDRWDLRSASVTPGGPDDPRVRYGSFLDQVDGFDPQFFGIAPREALFMDPQQRLLLEVTWEALERAGACTPDLRGSRTGVFVGMMADDYRDVQRQSADKGHGEPYVGTGLSPCFAAGRVSYVLGLQGPAMTVETACSSSLVCIHLACQSLRTRECNAAVAGGVNVLAAPESFEVIANLGALAADGRCKSFDAAADGFGRGEGCGVVILKRLPDAIADGDSVLAVIRGSAVNHDGDAGGLTVPNATAQQAVMREALANASVEAADITYIEAHGTGTLLGDPIEIRAIQSVYEGDRRPDRPLMLGSVKANIGHLEGAAGVASFMKVVLALQHAEIPPQCNLQTVNPHIALNPKSVIIPTSRTEWLAGAGRRLAAVSSFGMSGTNAHVIVEAPPRIDRPLADIDRPVHMLLLSGKESAAVRAADTTSSDQGPLIELARRFDHHLALQDAVPYPDVCYTAATGRRHFERRLAVVAADANEAREGLAAFCQGKHHPRCCTGCSNRNDPPEMAFLFTGQGSQYANMARDLYRTSSVFRDVLDRCDAILRPHLDDSLMDILYSGDERDHRLHQTRYTQPALVAVEIALAELWRSWGVVPRWVMGHSVGEFAAAYVAGILSLEAALELIAIRGRLMQETPGRGRMAAVRADEETVRRVMQPVDADVSIAALNGPSNTVLSGFAEGVSKVLEALKREGVDAMPLTVSHGFHSSQMDPMLDAFEQAASRITYGSPLMRVISNLTGQSARGEDLRSAAYWRRHAREPVRFADGIQSLLGSACDAALEIGPQPTLIAMAQQSGSSDRVAWLPSLRKGRDEWDVLLASLAELYVRGANPDWGAFDRPYPRRRVALPTYPFQHQRYWVRTTPSREREAPVMEARNRGRMHPLIGQRFRSPALSDVVFERVLTSNGSGGADAHRIQGVAVFPGAGFMRMAMAGASDAFDLNDVSIRGTAFHRPLALQEETARVIQLVFRPEQDDASRRFEIYSRGAQQEGDAWVLHADGDVVAATPHRPVDETATSGREASSMDQTVIRGDDYFRSAETAGFAFHDSYRSIERLRLVDRTAEAWAKGPFERDEYRETDPGVIMFAIQTLGAAVAHAGNETDVTLLVPTRVEEAWFADGGQGTVRARAQVDPSSLRADAVTGEVRLYDGAGRTVGRLDGVALKRMDAVPELEDSAERWQDWLYDEQWERWPASSSTEPPQSQSGEAHWILCCEASPFRSRLEEHCVSVGCSCTLVDAGATYEEVTESAFRIDPADREQVGQLIRRVTDRHGDVPWHVVHAWGLSDAGVDEPGPEEVEPVQRLVCGGALHLVQSLLPRASDSPTRLWFLTRGAQVVDASQSNTMPMQAPLWGVGRVLSLEHPELWGGQVDLDPDVAMEAQATSVFDRLQLGPVSEDQMARRAGQWWVPRLRRDNGRELGTALHSFDPEAAYLITGGTGHLGRRVARWMVDHGARHLILTSRRGSKDESESGQSDWQALRERGAVLEIVPGDVADLDRMRQIVDRCASPTGRLAGVIHTAAAAAPGTLADSNLDRLEASLRAKVSGTWVLHEATRGLDLDFFVMFSSVSALIGSADLAWYVAANQFLDAFAEHRRRCGLPSVSIDWGTWEGTVVKYDEGSIEFTEYGYREMQAEQALDALGHLVSKEAPPRKAVASFDWRTLKPAYEARRPRPYLEHIVVDAESGGGDLRRMLEDASPEARWDLLLDFLEGIVKEELGFEPTLALDRKAGFFELGMDSLTSMRLKRRVETGLGMGLPDTVMFSSPTVDRLGATIAADLLKLDMPGAPGDAVTTDRPMAGDPVTEEVPDADVESRLLGELDKQGY